MCPERLEAFCLYTQSFEAVWGMLSMLSAIILTEINLISVLLVSSTNSNKLSIQVVRSDVFSGK